ncbi:MAG: tetratricopeptide repeat protein [Anaerolineae bacterium]|nr:tetratricopeptide repeat protein [Anaerolineae bacterium]
MMIRITLLILALALVSACNLSQPEVIYVTATPDATATATQPPPTATIPATPTIEPATVLNLADNFLTNGYFENAVMTYQTVLDQGAPPEISASAAFRLGQAALQEGLFEQAEASLTAFIQQFPQDARLPQAYFLRGDAYLGLARWAEASSDFQQYLALRPGLVDSYAYERLGDAQLGLSQSEAALASYGQAVEASRSQVPLLALREKLAQVLLSAGQVEAALAQYDAILTKAENAPYKALIEYTAAQALINSGDLEGGLTRMQMVFETYPETTQAYQAMQTLLANDVELSQYDIGRVSYFYGDYEGAIEAFNTYSTQQALTEIPAEMQMLLGRAYRELGNGPAAEVAFRTVVDQYPQDPLFGEALLEQGRTRFMLGDIPGAIERYLEIADTYDYLDAAAEALWRAGYLYITNDDPVEAQVIFDQLADEFPDTAQARSGLFLAGSAAYSQGQLTRAEQFFSQLATLATGDEQAEAYLWVGRLALQRDDESTAQQALSLAVQASPDGYFSARAQDLLSGQAPFAPPSAFKFQFDDAAEIAAAEAWLRQTYNIEQEGDLWPLSAALEADPRMVRGRELWAVGAVDEAEVEFSDLTDAFEEDGLASYQLAIFFRGLGAYRESIVAAANVIRMANIGTLEAPAYIARMRYPSYYLDVVQEVGQRRNIDPLLLFSLIRYESLFDTYATAAAGEKGLTQVIPGTAEYIANQLNWPNYQHSVLFRPYAGIEFGAYYLDEQLQRFDGNVPASLAGYNAGPGRAASWLEIAGGDPDLFMSTITIDSTRGYVQRIYSSYNIYRSLYGESSTTSSDG